MNITIPFNFTPRKYQLPLFRHMDDRWAEKKPARAVITWHRRSGKDKACINLCAMAAMDRVGTYFYLLPTYAQAKKVIWDGKDANGFPFMGHFPQAIVRNSNESELRKELANGSAFQLIGTDNIDSIMGTNPIGCVFSEFSLQDPTAWDLIRPILRENGGWAIFNGTPRGKNHMYTLREMAKDNPEWFEQILAVSDTGVLSEADIQAERDEGMAEELIQQEYYCSFEGVQVGSFFGKELRNIELMGHMVSDLYEPAQAVETWWDIGVGDSTAIWFSQTVGHEVHLIDYLEASGEGIGYFAKELQKKPYVYRSHNGPGDLEVREWGSVGTAGKPITRVAAARKLGIDFRIVPDIGLEDGINTARTFLARCWFDKAKCKRGLDALQSYHKEYNEKMHDFKSHPVHDWSSHGADSFRYLAVGHRQSVAKRPRVMQDLVGWTA